MGMRISVLGVDLGKNVSSLVGFDESSAVVLRRRAKRETVIALAAKLAPCIVGMEACCGAYHLGHVFAVHGDDVRLMSPEQTRAGFDTASLPIAPPEHLEFAARDSSIWQCVLLPRPPDGKRRRRGYDSC